MYGECRNPDSASQYVAAASVPGVVLSEVRGRSVAMIDSDARSTDGHCGYRSFTYRAAARSVCRAARRTLPTGFQVGVRRLGAPDAEEKRAP